MNATLQEALKIAQTAEKLNEVLPDSNRHLFGFSDLPGVYVVAHENTPPLGLALLLVEQSAIIQAGCRYINTMQQLNALQNMPGAGGVQ